MFSSHFTFHPVPHKTLIEIRYVCSRPGTMFASFAISDIPSMSRLHVYVDLSLDPSGRLIDIGLITG